MSNIICFNSSAPKEEWLTMSNQGTDCFLELIIKAASDIAMTESQKDLINYLIERKDVNEIAPGTVSFDIDEMPWNPILGNSSIIAQMSKSLFHGWKDLPK